MIRIMIDWNMVSPFLQTISGILTVEEVDTTYITQPVTLIKCKVSRTPGSTGYSSIGKRGIPTDFFEQIKPFIEPMIHSYYNGIIMEKSDFHWVEEKFVDPKILRDWKEKIKNGKIEIK